MGEFDRLKYILDETLRMADAEEDATKRRSHAEMAKKWAGYYSRGLRKLLTRPDYTKSPTFDERLAYFDDADAHATRLVDAMGAA
jgi:hypothetical protein